MSEGIYAVGALDFSERCYDIYEQMRDEEPLYSDPRREFFAVSRYEDVRRVVNDDVNYSAEGVSTAVTALPIVQQIDPPLHDDLRALVTTAFTPRRVTQLEPRMREMAHQLMSKFVERGECDFMGEFARSFPSMVIGEMVGLPEERREPVLEWTESMVGINRNGDMTVDVAARAIAEEFRELLEARRSEPRDDLMSAMIAAEIDGGRKLTELELLGFCFQLVLAGNDTTTNLIANGAVLLANHADQRQEILDRPELLDNAIEEMLRIESPTQVLPRRVVKDVEFYGTTVPAESEIRLLWASANRDPRYFEEPERFDIHRKNAKRHLAFGQGRHFCVGAALARLEGKVAFQELLKHMPNYELTGDAPWLPSAWARAHTSVPLKFDAVSVARLSD
jgi:cytochrome P450